MDTIVNIPDHSEHPAAGTLPGELPPPPPARLERPAPPVFDEVTKPGPPPPPPPPRRSTCLRLGLALAFAAGLAGFCVALTAPPLDLPPPPMAGPGEEVAVADPLNDLMNVFMGRGVEQADQSCLPCFFRDGGRMRRAAGATEAFIAYKSDGALSSFAVHTHVFHPHPRLAAGVGPTPFSFWTAGDDDNDGEPDQWDHVVPQYRGEGNALGWERGVFFSGLPPRHFLKIVFHDMDGTWRPQVGHVQLLRAAPPAPQADSATPIPADVRASLAGPAAAEPEAEDEEERGPLDAAVAELVQMIAAMDTNPTAPAAPVAGPAAATAVAVAPTPAGPLDRQPVLRVVGDMRPLVAVPTAPLPTAATNPAETALVSIDSTADEAAQMDVDEPNVEYENEEVAPPQDHPKAVGDVAPMLITQA
eukprot:EG_transcript_8031